MKKMIEKTELEEMAKRFEGIPEELRQQKRWACWRYYGRNTKPYNPATGKPVSDKSPKHWTDYSTAVEAFIAGEGRYKGVAYVFDDDDPYVLIYIGGCNDQKATLVSMMVRLVYHANSYAEADPTGPGVQVLVRGSCPESYYQLVTRGCQLITVRSCILPNSSAAKTHRYYCLSGKVLLGGQSTINNAQEFLDELYSLHTEVEEDRAARKAKKKSSTKQK